MDYNPSGLRACLMQAGATGALLAGLGAPPATAQSAARVEGTPTVGIGDIIVTARRRAESIQSVPVAITALNAEQLRERGVVRLEDVRYQSPSLLIQPSPYGTSVPAFQIRGQRQQESLITQDPSVGVYIDDVYQARAQGLNQALVDLESVEVLKGPQGTLFGRNTTGGAILLRSHRPTNSFEGSVTAEIGNYDQRALTGVLNLPITEGLAVRGSIKIERRDGYATNVRTGQTIGRLDDVTWRAGALFRHGAFENYAVASAVRHDGNGFPIIIQKFGALARTAAFPGGAADAALARQAALGFYDFAGDLPRSIDNVRTFNFTDTATLDLDGVTIKNIFGYRRVRSEISVEFDGTDLQTLTGLPLNNSISRLSEHQISEELQLQGKAIDGRLNYTLGGYYFRESGTDAAQNIVGAFNLAQTTSGRARNESKSLFGQADFQLTSQLSIVGGIRYSWDRRDLVAQKYNSGSATVRPALYYDYDGPILACANGGAAATACRVGLPTYKASQPTWSAGVNYKPMAASLLYGSVSRGYRSGGYNLRGGLDGQGPFGTFGPYAPEKVTSYELGAKLDWSGLGIPLRTNAAVYYQDYRNIQRTVFARFPGDTANQTYVINASKARVKGAELEVTAQPAPGLELSGFLSYTNAKYTRFNYVVQGTSGGTQTVDASGLPFAGVPKWSWNVSGSYRLIDSDATGQISVRAQYFHQSQYFWQDAINDRDGQTKPYGLLDLRLDWRNLLGHPVDLSLFARNVTDHKYKTMGFAPIATVGYLAYIPGMPRTYGLSLTVRY